jgi:hypothetical protein
VNKSNKKKSVVSRDLLFYTSFALISIFFVKSYLILILPFTGEFDFEKISLHTYTTFFATNGIIMTPRKNKVSNMICVLPFVKNEYVDNNSITEQTGLQNCFTITLALEHSLCYHAFGLGNRKRGKSVYIPFA